MDGPTVVKPMESEDARTPLRGRIILDDLCSWRAVEDVVDGDAVVVQFPATVT